VAKQYQETRYEFVERDSEQLRDAFYNLDAEEFWKHYATYTGTKDGGLDIGSPFSCSC
jgi:hypothetical protein